VPLDAQVKIGPDGTILVADVENPGLPPIAVDKIKWPARRFRYRQKAGWPVSRGGRGRSATG
jgi:flagellar basal body rod protein FlgF